MTPVPKMRILSNIYASSSNFLVTEAAIAWGCFSRASSSQSASNDFIAVQQEHGAKVANGNSRIKQIRAEIFGDTIRPGEKDGRSILARKLQGKEIASWYFLPPTETPGLHNEEKE